MYYILMKYNIGNFTPLLFTYYKLNVNTATLFDKFRLNMGKAMKSKGIFIVLNQGNISVLFRAS